ncbi:unnamed protein product [Sphacelaria rigidula]
MPRSYLAALTGCDRGGEAEAGGSPAHGDVLPDPSPRSSQRHLLWWRHGSGPDRSIHSAPGPGIGEGEMSTVHFIIHSGTLFGKSLKKWLVTSSDTDQWIIVLLAMSSGCIKPHGAGAALVTVKRIVNGGPQYILVNRVYNAIESLRDGSHSAWPPNGQYDWLTPSIKVALFVLTYLLAGCDFLPHVSGIPFLKMWDFVLKAIRTPNLFTKAILADKDGRLRVEMDGGVKLLATVFFFRYENAFAQVATDPGILFTTCGQDLASHVNKIRLCITTAHGHQPSRYFPDLDACKKHVSKSDAVFEYWGGSFLRSMSPVNFNGRGWGIEPERRTHHKGGVRSSSTAGVELSRDNIVVYLSSHTYVDTSGNVQTLTCGCSPERAASKHRCRSCRCLGNCTLSCGCQGRCFLPPPPSRAAAAKPAEETGDGQSGARGQSRNGRSRSTVKHSMDESAASRGMGAASRASSAAGTHVDTTDGEEPRRGAGGELGGGAHSGPDRISETAGVDGHAGEQSRNGKTRSTAKHVRGESAASRVRGAASGASNTPGALVGVTDGGGRYWPCGGEPGIGGAHPGQDPIGGYFSDGGLDEPVRHKLSSAAGIWIGDSDSECSGSEREDSASAAVDDHEEDFAF